MNFAGLKRLIESADQSAFYDVALLELSLLGYGDLHVVDGPNDGGKDVESDRGHVQIQLSVRRDWEKKIQEEAKKAIDQGKSHLVFLTNRHITQAAEAKFRRMFSSRSKIELTILDSSRMATHLSAPGRIAKSYQLLGVQINANYKFPLEDIAASVTLLFGDEAQELREKTVDAVAMTCLRNKSGISEADLVEEASKLLPGTDPERLVASSISRLRSRGSILGSSSSISLSETEKEKVDSAESEMLGAREADVQHLKDRFELTRESADELMDIAVELTIRANKAGWSSAVSDDLKGFIRDKGLRKRKEEVYEEISKLVMVSKYQYIKTIDKLFSTNTLDIFRAFGGKTDLNIVLDTSVALPLLFGLEFNLGMSGYSSASMTMKGVADSHGFALVIPRPYLNEMASHGHKALQFLDIYETFEPELKSAMRSSPNAYLSHYAAVSERSLAAGRELLSLGQFLAHFGIKKASSLGSTERVIEGILEAHQIGVVWDNKFDAEIKDEIAAVKKYEAEIVVRHDAAVCTNLVRNVDYGYIFATWDRVLTDILVGGLRIYAENPGRIVDWLSFAQGIETGIDGSVEMLSALVVVDEGSATKVAEKLMRIKDVEEAYRLNAIIREARSKAGDGSLPEDEVALIIEKELSAPVPANDDDSTENAPSNPES